MNMVVNLSENLMYWRKGDYSNLTDFKNLLGLKNPLLLFKIKHKQHENIHQNRR